MVRGALARIAEDRVGVREPHGAGVDGGKQQLAHGLGALLGEAFAQVTEGVGRQTQRLVCLRGTAMVWREVVTDEDEAHDDEARDAHGGNHRSHVVCEKPPNGGKDKQRDKRRQNRVDEHLASIVRNHPPFAHHVYMTYRPADPASAHALFHYKG